MAVQLIYLFAFCMRRNKKFSKKKKSNKNVMAAVSQTEFTRGKNLIFVEYSPSKTSNNGRSSRNDRIPDVICIASSDDEDCLILSDVENSPKTSSTSDDANGTTKRTTSSKSPTSTSSVRPSAVPSDVVYISSSDEEDCLILSDVETPITSNDVGACVSKSSSSNKSPDIFEWNRPKLSVSQRRQRKMRLKEWSQRRKIRHSISNLYKSKHDH